MNSVHTPLSDLVVERGNKTQRWVVRHVEVGIVLILLRSKANAFDARQRLAELPIDWTTEVVVYPSVPGLPDRAPSYRLVDRASHRRIMNLQGELVGL